MRPSSESDGPLLLFEGLLALALAVLLRLLQKIQPGEAVRAQRHEVSSSGHVSGSDPAHKNSKALKGSEDTGGLEGLQDRPLRKVL